MTARYSYDYEDAYYDTYLNWTTGPVGSPDGQSVQLENVQSVTQAIARSGFWLVALAILITL